MEKVENPNSSSTTSEAQNSVDYGINNVEEIRKWKLPNINKNTIYSLNGWENLICDHRHIYKKKFTIPIDSSEVEIDLLDSDDIYPYEGYFHYGLVQVAVKFLRRKRTNASACCLLRDARFPDFGESVLGLASGSLSQGILYFICKLDRCVSLDDKTENILKSLQLKMVAKGIEMEEGPIPLSLTYAVYYRQTSSDNPNVRRNHKGDLGLTTVIKTKIHDEAYVPPTLSWNQIEVPRIWKMKATRVDQRKSFVRTNDGKDYVIFAPENDETLVNKVDETVNKYKAAIASLEIKVHQLEGELQCFREMGQQEHPLASHHQRVNVARPSPFISGDDFTLTA